MTLREGGDSRRDIDTPKSLGGAGRDQGQPGVGGKHGGWAYRERLHPIC